jgi:hypothetical protein
MDVQGSYVGEMKNGELDLQNGQLFLYLYDFGEEWEFDVKGMGGRGRKRATGTLALFVYGNRKSGTRDL